jgi:uncharacterized repeat protein (TIGR03803 family)
MSYQGQRATPDFSPSLRTTIKLFCAAIFATTILAQAQTFTVLHTFTGGPDGSLPAHGLTRTANGNLIGVTQDGGYYGGECDIDNLGCGTVFELIHRNAGWVLNTLYTFQGGSDGVNPTGDVVSPDGTVYGGTIAGGGFGQCGTRDYQRLTCGILFHLTPPASVCKDALCPWNETVLYRFTGESDGGSPFGDPIFDAGGVLYGTTELGGDPGCSGYDCGTVFNLTPSAGGWTESAIYTFTGYNDGYWPVSGVILDPNGNLYGTTEEGGQYLYGTAFQLTQSGGGWNKDFLYQFGGGPGGQYASGKLLRDNAGNLYGTTWTGGSGCGAVYELSPLNGSWNVSVLYNFPGNDSSCGPMDGVVMDAEGNLYGTTYRTGAYQQGVVFKLTPTTGGWVYSSLHDFTGGADGAAPNTLILGSDGDFYGETYNGGNSGCDGFGCGVLFEITP